MEKTELKRLLRRFGTYKLAQRIGIKHQSVVNWIKYGRVPPERVLAVEDILGVSRHDLRPDIFGPAPAVTPLPKRQEEAA